MRILLLMSVFLAHGAQSEEFCGGYSVQGKFLSGSAKSGKKEDTLVLNPNARAAINLKTEHFDPVLALYNNVLVDAEVEILSPECAFSCFGRIIKIKKISDPTLYPNIQAFHLGRTVPIEKKPCLKEYPKF